MGKGTIISGGANGLYTLNVDYGDALRQQYLTQINQRLSQLSSAIPLAEAKVIDQNNAISAADNAVQAAIAVYNAAILANPDGQFPELQKAIQDAVTAYATQVASLKPLKREADLLKAEQTGLTSQSSYLNSLNLIKVAPAWCADFTENATGQVATIEVPGEPRTVLIAPGAPQPLPADGQVLAREVMRSDQAYLNAALLPGWQKWKPTFRIGTITFVNQDQNTCSVDLQFAESSANQLPINQTEFLSGVPIQYMDCDAAVFAEGDEVIIRFDGQNWTQPKVVGFLKEPKQCAGLQFNGAVYLQILYYCGIVWSGNSNPDYSTAGFDFFPASETPITSWPYSGSGPDNATYFVSNISFNTEFLLLLPQALDKFVWDNRQTLSYTVNGNALQRDLSAEDYGYVDLSFDEYTMTDRGPSWPDYLNNRFQVSTYIGDEDPSIYAIAPCDKVISYVYIHEEYWPGNGDGGTVVGVAPNASYGVTGSQAIAVANARSEYTLVCSAGGKTLFSGTLKTTEQTGKPPGQSSLADGYVCLYDGTYKPSVPWDWTGSGISIPPEVTWII